MKDVKELNKDYMDLYGDALDTVIHVSEDFTLEDLMSYFPPTDQQKRVFMCKGMKIIAERKFTFKNGVMQTNYLHIYRQINNAGDTIHHKLNV